jgi:hypothetical protein
LVGLAAITDADRDLWVADILEDYVQVDHSTFVPLIEAELVINGRLRDAFQLVVPIGPDDDVNDRLLRLRENLARP